MATFSDQIKVTIDVVTEKAKTGLKSFRTEVGQAEGFVGKLKAGAGSLSSTLAGAGPGALAGAATAAGAAAFKMASDFSDLGVEVGKFSDATGLSAEQASRWVEVADDLGIGAEGLQGILGKLNKNIDPKLFADYGIEIAKTADGTVDANQTFLNTLDVLNRIKDPAERARTAAKLLGKGWQSAAELIGMSAKEVQDRLDGVAEAKVFDADKVKKARDFRDAMDNLYDSAQAVALELGESLAPALSEVADSVSQVTSAIGPAINALDKFRNSTVGGWTEDLLSWPSEVGGAISDGIGILVDGAGEFDAFGVKFKVTTADAADAARKLSQTQLDQYLRFLAEKAGEAADANLDLAAAEKKAYDRTRDLRQAMQDLNDIQLESMDTKADIISGVLEMAEAQQQYNDDAKEGTRSTSDLADEARGLAEKQAELAAKQEEVNGTHQTAAERAQIMIDKYEELQANLEPGSDLYMAIEAFKLQLLSIPTNVETRLSITDASGRGAASTSGAGALGPRTPDGERTQDRTTINVYPRTMPTQRELIDMNRSTLRRQGTTGN